MKEAPIPDLARRRRFTYRYWTSVLVLLLAGLAVSVYAVPPLIRAAYEGESVPVLNALIRGQDQHAVQTYLDLWSRIWLRAAAVFVLAAAMVYAAVLLRKRFLGRLADIARAIPATPPILAPLLGLSLGLAIGTLEGVYVNGYRLFGPDARGDVSRHVLWMAPLTGALLYGGIGLLFWPLARRWPRAFSTPVLLVLLGTPALFALTRALGIGIMPWAAWILGFGIAFALAREAARRPDGTMQLMRRATPVLAGWTIVAASIVLALDPLRTAIGLARLPAPASGPNIVLLILDTVRSANLSLYGYARPTTPTLERIGGQGVVFDRAIATSSWTLPSHASMLTGRYNVDLGTNWHAPLDGTHPTLAEVLRDRGYETAAFVGNIAYTSRESGLLRGFLHAEDQPVSVMAAVRNSWLLHHTLEPIWRWFGNERKILRKRADAVSSGFLDWLDDRSGDRPFFAFLNYFDAHDPYIGPPGTPARFAAPDARYWLGPDGTVYDPETLRDLVDRYDDGLARLDAHLDTLFRELERRDVLDNTILVIASDHGEQFGEQAPHLVLHGNTLAYSSIHVPLLFRYPTAVPAGVRVRGRVSLVDIAATILDLARQPAELPGTSLAVWWDPARTRRSRPPLSEVDPNWHSIRTGPVSSLMVDELHYVSNGNGTEELYNVAQDPWERRDLAETAEGKARIAALRASLDSLLAGYEPVVSRAVVSSSKR